MCAKGSEEAVLHEEPHKRNRTEVNVTRGETHSRSTAAGRRQPCHCRKNETERARERHEGGREKGRATEGRGRGELWGRREPRRCLRRSKRQRGTELELTGGFGDVTASATRPASDATSLWHRGRSIRAWGQGAGAPAPSTRDVTLLSQREDEHAVSPSTEREGGEEGKEEERREVGREGGKEKEKTEVQR